MANFYLDKQGLRALIVKIVDEIKANQFVTNDVLTLGDNGATGANHKNTWTVGVDGTTIVKDNQNHVLKSGLGLEFLAASGEGDNAKKARIALVDANNTELDAVNVESIIGSNILNGSSYSPETGLLTLNFVGMQNGVDINLGALLDYDDIVVASGSNDYLSAVLTNNPNEETGNTNSLTLGAKIVNPSAATDSSTGLADAYQVKQYVESQLGDTAISAQGDSYITAAVDGSNNKKINVQADVQSLTATAGTVGVYGTDGSETTAPVAGTLSGTAQSLADAADIAAKVKTYVDGAIAIEAARSDAKNKADIAALDGTANVTTGDASAVDNVTKTTYGKALTGVSETNGVIAFGSEAAFDAAGAANAAYTDAISAVRGYKVNNVSFAPGLGIAGGWTIDGGDINVDDSAVKKETVKAAIERIDTALGAGGSVASQIEDAINALDGTAAVSATGASAGNDVGKTSYGYALTQVKETDGKVVAVGTNSSTDSMQVAFDLAGAANAAYNDAAALKVNNKALSTNPVLGGADIALTGYSKGLSSAAVADTDTVNQAIGKLENQIGAVSTSISNLDGAATAGATNGGTGYNATVEVLTKVNQVAGVVQAVGTETNSSLKVSVDAAGAAAAAYTAAAAHTINGQNLSDNPVLDGSNIALTGYTKPESGSAIAATDSVNAAIGKLEAKVDATAASMVHIPDSYVNSLWDYVAGTNADDPDTHPGSR